MDRIAVLIPCYNVEKYLRQCLDSVVNQTLEDMEIIAINDGSTDSAGKADSDLCDDRNQTVSYCMVV